VAFGKLPAAGRNRRGYPAEKESYQLFAFVPTNYWRVFKVFAISFQFIICVLGLLIIFHFTAQIILIVCFFLIA